jgi:hypothetical protein
MDPFTLLIMGAAALAGAGLATSRLARSPFRFRKLKTWPDGWIATELLSVDALATAASAMNVPLLAHRGAELKSGFRRFVLVTKKGAPPSFAVICIYDRIGSSVELAESWGCGMTKPSKPEQWQHIRELTQFLQRDIGRMVYDMAVQIADPDRRYKFLQAVARNPQLSAHVVPDNDFADIVATTTAKAYPDRYTKVAMAAAPAMITYDMGISPVPAVRHATTPLIPGRAAPQLEADED